MIPEKFLSHFQVEISRHQAYAGSAFLAKKEGEIVVVTAGHVVDHWVHADSDRAGILGSAWRAMLHGPRMLESTIFVRCPGGSQVPVAFEFQTGRDIALGQILEGALPFEPLTISMAPVEESEQLRAIGNHPKGLYDIALNIIPQEEDIYDPQIIWVQTAINSHNTLPPYYDASTTQPIIWPGMSGFAVVREETGEAVGVFFGMSRQDRTVGYVELFGT